MYMCYCVHVHVTDGEAGTDMGFVDGTRCSVARLGFQPRSARPAVPMPSFRVGLFPELLSGNWMFTIFMTMCG